jgi:putative thioredoxin
MTPEIIIDVNEMNFEYEVLTYSQNIPVITEFWANWCRPCKPLNAILERIALDADGAFRLARINVDENPNLTMQFNVRSVPTVKAFSQREVVAEFVGEQTESRLREFFSKITPPSSMNLNVEKAKAMLYEQDWHEAEANFREVLQQDPAHLDSLLGLSKALLAQGKSAEAALILRNFPPGKQLSRAETLLPLSMALNYYDREKLPADNDLDASFANSIKLIKRGNFAAALDGLLDNMRSDKHYRDDQARKIILGLFEILGDDNEITKEYRSELAFILF